MDFAAPAGRASTVTSPYDNRTADQPGRHDRLRPARRHATGASRRSPTSAPRSRTSATQQPAVQGLEIEYGGDLFGTFELPESEILGIIAAVIILILAFGSVLAMGLPIGTALFGLGVASAIVALASNVISMPDFTTAMVAMIGLGVGIDYALFIVTRYREGLKLGLDRRGRGRRVHRHQRPSRAVRRHHRDHLAARPLLMGLSFVTGVAIASAIGVFLMIIGSLTLLPALLGLGRARASTTPRAPR